MYTLDYIKSLHIDLEEWNLDPGSLILTDGYTLGEHFMDDTLEELLDELNRGEDEEDFIEAIRKVIQDDLCIGTVKSILVKEPDGKLIAEYDDLFYA